MSKDNKKSLVELYQANGLLFPANSNEVLAFENSNDLCDALPKDWDNPINIINRGKIKKVNFNSINLFNESVSNLSMAARDGKAISDEIRNKMNDDRKQSKNKQ